MPMKKVIREIKKRDKVYLRVSLIDMAGQPYLEVRQYQKGRYDEMNATDKGFTCKPDIIDELVKGLLMAKKALGKDDKRET